MSDFERIQEETKRKVRVRIEGQVQGVGFRYWTERSAARLGLAGWVRNRRDGSVEAVFAGPADAVEQMLKWCRKGPPSAGVELIEVRQEDVAVPDTFEMRPTV